MACSRLDPESNGHPHRIFVDFTNRLWVRSTAIEPILTSLDPGIGHLISIRTSPESTSGQAWQNLIVIIFTLLCFLMMNILGTELVAIASGRGAWR
jgi:hypothetical protein